MTFLTESARLNPVPYEGSLIWWLHVPTSQQNYLQAILEAYDGMGYYQTFGACTEKNEQGESMSLARLTSTIDAKAGVTMLLEGLSREINFEIPDFAPSFEPSEQPRA